MMESNETLLLPTIPMWIFQKEKIIGFVRNTIATVISKQSYRKWNK